MSQTKKTILLLILGLIGVVVFPFIRGPVACLYGGVFSMTGSDCHCVGFWQETKAFEGHFDEVHEGMCVGYRL